MAEGDDYSPGAWSGHDFTSARKTYDANAGRGYAAVAASTSASDHVPEKIKTKCPYPLLVWCDVTGSMGGWPGTIFSKLPYLDHEVRTEYLGEEAEICFGAISDTGDAIPLQVQAFAKGKKMKDALEKLHVTSGGAGPGSYCEAYSVAALYANRNIDMDKAIRKPILIFIGDEMPYHVVSKEEALNYAHVHMKEGRLSEDEIFEELMEKYSVYLVQKPYDTSSLSGDQLTGSTKQIHAAWVKLIGSDRIAMLPDAGRVVDVIFGILAKECGKIDYFRKEIEGRQEPGQVKTVYTALKTVHKIGAGDEDKKPKTMKALGAGKSTMHKPGGGKKSGDLL